MRKLSIKIGLLVASLVIAVLWMLSLRKELVVQLDPGSTDSASPSAAQPAPSATKATQNSLGQNSNPSGKPNAQARIQALLVSIQDEKDPIRRAELIRQLIAAAAGSDMAELLSQIRATEGLEDVEVEMVLAWAKTNPAVAAQWALALPPGQTRDQHLNSVATAWADSDLAAATAWLSSLPPEVRTDSALAVAHEAGRIDPISALKILTGLPASDARNDLAFRAIREWTAQDPAAASQWALGISDPTLRQAAIAEAAAVWGSIDPEAAAIFAIGNLAPSDSLSHVVIDIIQNWTTSAPNKAADWAALFPEGKVRTTAFQSIIPAWFDSDPSAVAQWLANQPVGTLKDQGTAEYATALAQNDAPSALAALNGIANEPLRQQQAERIAADWLSHEPEAARRWIESSDLPAPAKERLLVPKPVPAPTNP